MALGMVQDMALVGMGMELEPHKVVGMELDMVEDMLLADMELGMELEPHKVVGMELDMVEDMLLVGMAVGMGMELEPHKVVDMELDMVEDMRVGMALRMELDMVEDIRFCKVLDKQACRAEDILACKAHKWARKAGNNHHHSDWNSLSKEVPKHPKKATRLGFPVVFSLKDSLC
jgi:hypothetical protein